jgi:PPIC-type PPIASE domain
MPARGQAARLTVALGLCLIGLTACGGGVGDDATVVKIGRLAISKATVEHWAAVVQRGGAFSGFRGAPPHGTALQRAITLLVTSNWLVGEAKRQGVAAPAATIDQALAEREQTPEFQRQLRKTGQTIAGVRLEMSAELDAEAIREKLAGRAAHFTQQELVDFYHANPQQFRGLEVRVTDLLENQPSSAAAASLVRRIGTGRAFTKLAYHEHVSRTPGFMRSPEKVKVVDAIFAAHPGVVSRPVMLNGHWAVFVVRKVVPPPVKPLSSVRAEAARQLNVVRQHEIAARFDSEYILRWHARTSCRSGYVAPGCPQFAGQLGAYEDPFSKRAHPLLSESALGS